jgi:hypothetical protein
MIDRNDDEWKALLGILEECKLSLVELADLHCFDLEVEEQILKHRCQRLRHLKLVSGESLYSIEPYSKVFPILNHQRTRLRSPNGFRARLFPYSPKTIGNRIKALTGKTRREYLKGLADASSV